MRTVAVEGAFSPARNAPKGRPAGLRSARELAEGRPHGHRLRYIAGCRCEPCRRANCAYAKCRAKARKEGDWNGLVPAQKARNHLVYLSELGVGRRAAADACDISETVLQAILTGRRKQIRARTERAILALSAQAAADRALIDAGPTWALLDELLAVGYTKSELARGLGRHTRALQLQRTRVTARNAYEVQCLHARLRRVPAPPALKLLDDLAQEGFHRERVVDLLSALANFTARPAPDLRIRRGTLLHSTVDLVALLHAELTGEAAPSYPELRAKASNHETRRHGS